MAKFFEFDACGAVPSFINLDRVDVIVVSSCADGRRRVVFKADGRIIASEELDAEQFDRLRAIIECPLERG